MAVNYISDTRTSQINALVREVYQDLAEGVQEGAKLGLEAMARDIGVFLKSAQATHASTFTKYFRPLGAAAAAASGEMLEGSQHGPYRVGAQDPFNRYGGGLLKAALESPTNYVVSSRGIKFGNDAALYEANAGWHRLNYGIGAEPPAQFPVSFLGGQSTGSLSAIPLKEDEPFYLPPGYFRQAAQTEYYPMGYLRYNDRALLNSLRKENKEGGNVFYTRGKMVTEFPAKHFLDAGVKVIADGIGPASYQAVREVVIEALENATKGQRGAIVIDKKLYKYQLRNIL